MSLLNSASPWSNDNISKKRLPSIRKTLKKQPSLSIEKDESPLDLEESPETGSLENIEEEQEERNRRIQQVLSTMSQVNADNEGSGLADFQPLSHPLVQKNGQVEGKEADEEIAPLQNELQGPPPRIQQTIGDFHSQQEDSRENPYHINHYGNYRKIYEPPKITPPHDYYAKMGLGKQPTMDNQLMEKINYMIHMLEQQQNEKTSNLTEEFILYIFLGVFIIFIVDSFTRSTGKYVR